MKYFIDTEFKEKPNTIDFISIGIITENGDEYYAISKDFNLKEVWKDDWLKENVLKTLHADLCKMVGTYGKTYHWRQRDHHSKFSQCVGTPLERA